MEIADSAVRLGEDLALAAAAEEADLAAGIAALATVIAVQDLALARLRRFTRDELRDLAEALQSTRDDLSFEAERLRQFLVETQEAQSFAAALRDGIV